MDNFDKYSAYISIFSKSKNFLQKLYLFDSADIRATSQLIIETASLALKIL